MPLTAESTVFEGVVDCTAAAIAAKVEVSVAEERRMKEFSGGRPPVGWAGGALSSVTEWKPEEIDQLSELICDHLATGGRIEDLLLEVMHVEIRAQMATAVRRALRFIRESAKPALTADQLAWVCGMSLMDGEALGKLAKRHGISKQAFQQGAEQLRTQLYDTGRSQTARPETARKHMRENNSRRTKPDPRFLKV